MKVLVVLGSTLMLTSLAAASEPAATIRDAFRLGTADLGLRWRFEEVDDDRFTEDSRASTLRATLAAATARWHGLALAVEAEAVIPIGFEDDYADSAPPEITNGVTGRPVIADPEITELQRATLSWANLDGTFELAVGREPLLVGDQRFVGPVGWRQNNQTFDGAFLRTSAIPQTKLLVATIDEVQRINGSDLPMASWLVATDTTLPAGLTLSFVGLELDLDRPANATLSTRTLSLALSGHHELEVATLDWRLRAAEQDDATGNPRTIDVPYQEVRFGVTRGPIAATLGWEVLGAEVGRGSFQTPLATLHAFNGWVDLFVQTPPDGLDDRFLKVVGTHGLFGWDLRLHDFHADLGGRRYGREADLQLTWRTASGVEILVKGARFESDGFAADITKLWAGVSTKLAIGR